MILFLQVTRDKKNKKKKFFLQYTRHKILLTEIIRKLISLESPTISLKYTNRRTNENE